MTWETVIGLEVHLRLSTASKLFCGCANRYGAAPNTLTCPVCLGLPGTLPVLNGGAVAAALRLAVALGSSVHRESGFARKQYIYPDLPRNYQITQLDPPFASGGASGASGRAVPLERLHLEEDAGRLDHTDADHTRVDFNRAGTPLLEIVTPPVLTSGVEAGAFLRELQALARWLDVSDARMEQGGMRCDANISLRPHRDDRLGSRVELKNMNSPRHVRQALEFEERRQAGLLDAGVEVAEETRTWLDQRQETATLRTKEDTPDYRYLPEPDLPCVVVSDASIAAAITDLPERPEARRRRLESEMGLPPDAAAAIIGSRSRADLFEEMVAAGADAGDAARLLLGGMAALANTRSVAVEALQWNPAHLAELLAAVGDGGVPASRVPDLLAAMVDHGAHPLEEAARRGFEIERDPVLLDRWVETVLAAHPENVAAWRHGRSALEGWLVGQVLAESGGRADPRDIRRKLAALRGDPGDPDADR